jgi:hypothetical protein
MRKTSSTILALLISMTISSLAATAQVDASALMQLAKLTASDGTAFSQLGTEAAISGNTAVVGTYVFVKGANGWANMTESARLVSSDGFVGFNQEAAISGNTIAISGYDNSTNTYGVYIFEKPGGGWTGNVTETAILSTFYGLVAISGNTIVVGGGSLVDVFVRPAGGWKNTAEANATLNVPLTAGVTNTTLAVSGTAVVAGVSGNFGGTGTVYVYVKPGTGWSGNLNPTATLAASNGRLSDGLGWSVAIGGNTIVAGASNANQSFGAVYVFVQPAGGWTSMTETAELMAPNTIDLGWSVGINGNAVVGGAPFTLVGANQFQGAAYVYIKPSTGWKSTSTPNAELTATDGAANDWLSYSVGISNGTIIAGAPDATIGSNQGQGAVYVFGK